MLAIPLFASPSPTPHEANESVLPEIQSIIATLEKNAHVSLIVQNRQGTTLFSHHPDTQLMPASTQKVATALIAASTLPEHPPFHTSLHLHGKMIKNTLKGDLILTGQGDPLLSAEDLDTLLKPLRKKAIQSIEGRIILNTHDFDQRAFIPGTFWEELNDCYAAPTSALSFQGNCFPISLTFNRKKHRLEVQTPYPKSQPVILDVMLKNSCAQEKDASIHHTVFHEKAVLDHDPFQTPWRISGCWSPNHHEERFKVSMLHPEQIIASHIQAILKKHSITHKGPIKIIPLSNLPAKAVLISKHASLPLSHLLKIMLHQSDNHIANQLFKRIAKYTSPSKALRASWEMAETAALNVLQKHDILPLPISYADGAGLSRNNRISASSLQRILMVILKKRPSLIPLLPNNQLQHPLQKRFGALDHPLYAKTGQLKGTLSLVGYLNPASKDAKIFTLFVQGHKYTVEEVKAYELDLLKAISKLA